MESGKAGFGLKLGVTYDVSVVLPYKPEVRTVDSENWGEIANPNYRAPGTYTGLADTSDPLSPLYLLANFFLDCPNPMWVIADEFSERRYRLDYDSSDGPFYFRLEIAKRARLDRILSGASNKPLRVQGQAYSYKFHVDRYNLSSTGMPARKSNAPNSVWPVMAYDLPRLLAMASETLPAERRVALEIFKQLVIKTNAIPNLLEGAAAAMGSLLSLQQTPDLQPPVDLATGKRTPPKSVELTKPASTSEFSASVDTVLRRIGDYQALVDALVPSLQDAPVVAAKRMTWTVRSLPTPLRGAGLFGTDNAGTSGFLLVDGISTSLEMQLRLVRAFATDYPEIAESAINSVGRKGFATETLEVLVQNLSVTDLVDRPDLPMQL